MGSDVRLNREGFKADIMYMFKEVEIIKEKKKEPSRNF
jgi:hypothetical protein